LRVAFIYCLQVASVC